MRISDWSSDVCSSDLLARRHHLAQLGAGNLHPIRRKIRELPAGQVVVKHFGEDAAIDLAEKIPAAVDHLVQDKMTEPALHFQGVDSADRKSTRLNSSH